MPYAKEAAQIGADFDVFPSNEATLLEARGGGFAGCISATANVNAPYCAKAFRDGDEGALAKAVAIRGLFAGKPLVAGVKALVSHTRREATIAEPMPPLVRWSDADERNLFFKYDRIVASA
jgi:4-hydroxy-tetrahydrodipicolinate synthase